MPLEKQKEKNVVLAENKDKNNEKTLCLLKVVTVEKAKSLRGMVAPKTLANFLNHITQLYEQVVTVRRIGQYVKNWWRWARAGVEISDEPSHIRARINSH